MVGGLHRAVADRRPAGRRRVPAGRIRLHHYASEAALRTLMRECDATVFVSLAEGFGLPIVESLWQGKPCLCSNIGSMAEIAADGGCLGVDPRDPDAIEGGLERLAEDAELRAELAVRRVAGPDATGTTTRRPSWPNSTALSTVPLLAVIEGSAGGGEAIAAALEAASAAGMAAPLAGRFAGDSSRLSPRWRIRSPGSAAAILRGCGRCCRSLPRTDRPRRCESRTRRADWA